ncbi:MAG: GNAT family N-acetyltransferase [Pseudomonadota bacterium]
MEIRMLEPADAAKFRALRLKALREDPNSFMRNLKEEELLSEPEFGLMTSSNEPPTRRFVIGAFEDGRLFATCGFRRLGQMNLRHKGELWAVYVDPEGRGKGVGRQVMTACLEAVRRVPGLERINVYAAGAAARDFYRRFGFESFGLEKKAKKIGDHYSDLEYMALELTEAPCSEHCD